MSPSTTRHLIISSALLLISLGVFIFGIKEIGDKTESLQTQMSALSSEQNQESSLYRLQKIEEESRLDRERLSRYFLSQGSDSIDFLNRVETLAPTAGVAVETKSLEEMTDKKTKQQWIQVDFVFSGTQENVERFLALLEHLPYLSQITKTHLAVSSGDSWEASVTMRVFILSYDK